MLEVKEVNKLNDTIAQHHMLFFTIIISLSMLPTLERPDCLTS